MSSNSKLRPIGIGFLCCGLGGLAAALVAREPMFLGIAIPFLGVGIAFLAKSRQPG